MEMGIPVADHRLFILSNHDTRYQVSIAGGGLAGLALAIQLAKSGFSVLLIEKAKYPFHKVCGEYISLESMNFLETLGVPLSEWQVPIIRNLRVSAPGGNTIDQPLPLGGFGVSRYKLDAAMAKLAVAAGVVLMEETKVEEIIFSGEAFEIRTNKGIFYSRLACASFGKRSNLDIKWKRSFLNRNGSGLNNYIGVKYHVLANLPEGQIALHNFENGYCGISKIEDGKYCLCYMTTAKNLRDQHNSIPKLEQRILSKNPHLKKLFSEVESLYDQPLVISQISFSKKTQVEDHVLCVGDAAGMITPLCGNGMSMALHGSKIAFECMQDFFEDRIDRAEMESLFCRRWNTQFASRLKSGRIIQRLFGNPVLTNWFLRMLKPFPAVIRRIIQKTHGSPF